MTDVAASSLVPVQPAASVLLVADRPGLEVLLLHRRAGSVFVGGMVVFPGGAVDESDRSEAALRLVAGDVVAGDLSTDAARAHLVAAAREALEEVGLWIGDDPEALRQARHDIDTGRRRICDVAASGSIPAEQLPHVGHWVTPPGPSRRYDTHFFVGRSPDVIAEPDGREVVSVEWSAPAEALRRLETGELAALDPTVAYLEALVAYDSVSAVLESAHRGDPVEHDGGWTTI